MLAQPLWLSDMFSVGGRRGFCALENDDGLHPHGPCGGYAVYSSITEAFWQIPHERQKTSPNGAILDSWSSPVTFWALQQSVGKLSIGSLFLYKIVV